MGWISFLLLPVICKGLCSLVIIQSDTAILEGCTEPPSGDIEPGIVLVSPAIDLQPKKAPSLSPLQMNHTQGDPPAKPYVFTLPLRDGVDAYLSKMKLGRDTLACEWMAGAEWQRRDCISDLATVPGAVICSCSHLTVFGIVLRSAPLPLELQYTLVPCYGFVGVCLFVQLIRICCGARAIRKCRDSPALTLTVQHTLMLLVVAFRIWFVILTGTSVWPPQVTLALGLLPSLLTEILVLHVVAYWTHILAFPMQKDRWASLRVPFGILGFALVLLAAAMGVAVQYYQGDSLVQGGNITFAAVSALTFAVVLVSGRGMVHLLEDGPDSSLAVRYSQVTLGLCLSLFFQAVALVVSVELPDQFVSAAAVFYAWDVLSLACLGLLYARGVAALWRRVDLRASLQEGNYKPLKPPARNGVRKPK